jgi:hypothetical protein
MCIVPCVPMAFISLPFYCDIYYRTCNDADDTYMQSNTEVSIEWGVGVLQSRIVSTASVQANKTFVDHKR